MLDWKGWVDREHLTNCIQSSLMNIIIWWLAFFIKSMITQRNLSLRNPIVPKLLNESTEKKSRWRVDRFKVVGIWFKRKTQESNQDNYLMTVIFHQNLCPQMVSGWWESLILQTNLPFLWSELSYFLFSFDPFVQDCPKYHWSFRSS